MGQICLRTETGGSKWTPFVIKSPQGDTIPVFAMEFLTENIGFCTAGTGHILKTTDAGKSWSYIREARPNDGMNIPLMGIHFKDEMHGVATGMYGLTGLVITSDGGKTWKVQLEIDGRRDWQHYKLIFPTLDFGIIYGAWGGKERTPWAYTEDGGQTWHLAGITNYCKPNGEEAIPAFKCICFGNETMGLALGDWFNESYQTQTGGKPVSWVPAINLLKEVLKLHPNPNQGYFSIEIVSPIPTELNIAVFDVTGRLIYENSVPILSGNNDLPFELKGISSGMYSLRVRLGAESQQIKLVIE